MSIVSGGLSASATLSAGFLSTLTTTTGSAFSGGGSNKITIVRDDTATTGFALFICAALVAASAIIPGLAAGGRGRVLQHWLLVVSLVLSSIGTNFGDQLFLLAYVDASTEVAMYSSYYSSGSGFSGSASMPGRAVAITGHIVNTLIVMLLARWQRDDAPGHYGGMGYITNCWPDKRAEPARPLTPVAPGIKTAEELAAERALALWNQPTPLQRHWRPASPQAQPQAYNPILVVTKQSPAMV